MSHETHTFQHESAIENKYYRVCAAIKRLSIRRYLSNVWGSRPHLHSNDTLLVKSGLASQIPGTIQCWVWWHRDAGGRSLHPAWGMTGRHTRRGRDEPHGTWEHTSAQNLSSR